MTITVQLPQQLDERLSYLAQQTEKAKSDCLIEALENYLEDLLLSNTVIERIKSGKERTYTAVETKDALKLTI